MNALRRFFLNEGGVTSIEYGVIGAVVSIACLVGARSIGTAISSKFLGPLASAFN